MSSATRTSLAAIIERSPLTSYVLLLTYALSLVYSVRRFTRVAGCTCGVATTPLLFVASVVFVFLLRTLSFTTLAVLAFTNIDVSSTSSSIDVTGQALFYDRVLSVLFNVGDFAVISTVRVHA